MTSSSQYNKRVSSQNLADRIANKPKRNLATTPVSMEKINRNRESFLEQSKELIPKDDVTSVPKVVPTGNFDKIKVPLSAGGVLKPSTEVDKEMMALKSGGHKLPRGEGYNWHKDMLCKGRENEWRMPQPEEVNRLRHFCQVVCRVSAECIIEDYELGPKPGIVAGRNFEKRIGYYATLAIKEKPELDNLSRFKG